MKETKNKNVFVKLLLHMAGVLLCVVPPAVCTLSYFPLWKSAGYVSCISGGVAFLLETAPKAAAIQEPAKQTGKKSGKKKSKKKAKSNKGLITLAVVETLGILGLAAYWVLVLLK